jgi:hypothetical protein
MKRQILYINSALRLDGTPSSFRISLGNDALSTKRGYTSQMAVAEATISRSWYNISNPTNIYRLTPPGWIFTIPAGNYNVLDVRSALASLLPSGWTVLYSRLTSRYTIIRPDDDEEVYILDLMELAPLLGYTPGSTVIFTKLIRGVTSPNPARIATQNSILIHSDISTVGGSVLDNSTEVQAFNDSTVIAKVPINAAPDSNIIFRVESDLSFVQLTATNVDTVRFWCTDESYKAIPLLFDWSCTIVVTHEPDEDSTALEVAKDSRDYLQLLALNKSLPRR